MSKKKKKTTSGPIKPEEGIPAPAGDNVVEMRPATQRAAFKEWQNSEIPLSPREYLTGVFLSIHFSALPTDVDVLDNAVRLCTRLADRTIEVMSRDE
ncbi:hypothetical protein CMI47_04245 [Candidatus Pacearchaeota archaeon]|jgi:hypothetical protein|nr:hypothetical protein [Candidatus Pacearchaeota archaeon]|tara:strand:- start:172 stop:462 length:291 start_codon:yes stop_codon:yes gene_type:complete